VYHRNSSWANDSHLYRSTAPALTTTGRASSLLSTSAWRSASTIPKAQDENFIRHSTVDTPKGLSRKCDSAKTRWLAEPPAIRVVVEAGDRVPADGRLLSATSLEVQESMLTVEAQPSAKSASAGRTPVYMTMAVTRGNGEVLVTATGVQTETAGSPTRCTTPNPGRRS